MEPIDRIGHSAGRRALADAAASVDVERGLELVKSGAATVRPQPYARRSPARLLVAAVAALFVVAATGTVLAVILGENDGTSNQPPPDNPPPIPPNTNPGVVAPDPSDNANPTTSTSGPATTDDPPSSTTVVTSPPTSSTAEVPRGVQNWPPRSLDPPPIKDIPRLLPTRQIPNATIPSRREGEAREPGYYDYTQTWFDAERDAYLIVTTNIDQVSNTHEGFQIPVDTSRWPTEWDQAYFVQSEPGSRSRHLRLTGPGGYVALYAFGLDRTDVLDIARTMQRRPTPEPGWDLPTHPDGMRPFGESGDAPPTSRNLLWTDNNGSKVAELTVSTEYAEAVTTNWDEGTVVDTIDLDGTTAVVTDYIGRVAISWPLDDNVQALFGYQGDRSTAESIVRSLETVDHTTWRILTRPRDPNTDGCQSLFC